MISIDYSHCTFCGACAQICPAKCISMEMQNDGFIYPNVEASLCVDCGKCDTVCPIDKSPSTYTSSCYAAVVKNDIILEESSSGGIFGAIATYILQKGGVVYGCAFSDAMEAKHMRVDSSDDLRKLFGSKYVQSDTDHCFITVREDLENGKIVLFSGTPCQVAGLKYFLGKEYDGLLLVDIVCHGVPSQSYFDKYIAWLEEKEQSAILDIQFRSKRNHGWSNAGNYLTSDSHGQCKTHKLFYFNHYYYFYYLESSIYRESCYHCKYANLNREGDFTLGDLWGAEGLDLDFDIRKGCSLLLVNSEKAIAILNELDIDKQRFDISYAVKHNEQLSKPSARHPDRDRRLEEFRRCSGAELQIGFLTENKIARIKGKIKYLIPEKSVRMINRIRYSFTA